MRIDHCEIIETESKIGNSLRIRYFGKDKKVDKYVHVVSSKSPIYHLLLSYTEVEDKKTFRPIEKDVHDSFAKLQGKDRRTMFEKLDDNNKPIKSRRELIFLRDGNKCLACGSEENLTIDHIIPKAQDGDNTEDNLQTLCEECNHKKGNRIRDYRNISNTN